MKLKTFTQFKKEALRRPGVKKATNDMNLEFQIIEAMIEARMRKGVTQKTLAEKIGVAQSALARFESGKSNPTLSFLQKVTEGLGLQLVIKA